MHSCPAVQRKENVMRSRLLTLVFIAVLTMSFAACSKKDQTQNTAAPASDASTAAQSQSATTGQPAGSQMTPAPAQETAKAPEPPPPPLPLVVPAGTHIVIRMANSITSKTANL